ncbi:HvfC/BufC N-terminal domain-containing protein [Acuticoccus yangtzensis]|uniref:HvfC/BufC N-terminal domain-containing protein n=1 Tax=Acuticoccus yangtzensis TaxID=1443441 RepID=UPI000AD7F3BA|nr:DNA-binding domain-containing protein [Acuticoccus yangtzensis]
MPDNGALPFQPVYAADHRRGHPAAPARNGAEADAFADAVTTPGRPLAGIVDGTGRPAADRLDVYRNTIVASLADALAATFPATARLMGEDDFRGAAVAFAVAVKPRSPVLSRYGAGFPDFLIRSGHVAPYVAECARIEYARVQAFHAADVAPLDPGRLGLAPGQLDRLVLTPHPATSFIPTPGGGYCAWRDGQPGIARAVVVTRPRMDVLVSPLMEPGARFARRLLAGMPLGEAAAVDGLDLTKVLAVLLSCGAFATFP